MSTCSRPGPSARRSAEVCAYSMVTRSWLMRLVLSGHRGGSLASSRQVLLVGKARDGIVGLRLEIGAGDAALGHGGKERQAPAGDEAAHQRGDEHGLARARQPRDAEPQRRRHQVEESRAGALEGVRCGARSGLRAAPPLPFSAPAMAKKGAAARPDCNRRAGVSPPPVTNASSLGLVARTTRPRGRTLRLAGERPCRA